MEQKQNYFELVGSKKFIGVQAKTLCADDVSELSSNKDALYYLLKYDGTDVMCEDEEHASIEYLQEGDVILNDRTKEQVRHPNKFNERETNGKES